MSDLWILIWKWSHVLEPSPQVFSFCSLSACTLVLSPSDSFLWVSDQVGTHLSSDFTSWLVNVILIQWIATSGSTGVFPVSLKAMAAAWPTYWLVPQQEPTAVSQHNSRLNRAQLHRPTCLWTLLFLKMQTLHLLTQQWLHISLTPPHPSSLSSSLLHLI